MASFFGHVTASTALGVAFFHKNARPAGLLLLGGFCAFAPDLDVLSFQFGIPYQSIWGHRGWTHSIFFALLLGTLAGWVYAGGAMRAPGRARVMVYLVLCTLSHPLLDMLTNGGRGIALFFPFSAERIFFPYRPILVSPLGAANFFSEWGMRVLESEFCWIGLPSLALALLSYATRKISTI